jgi:hypothetical protein
MLFAPVRVGGGAVKTNPPLVIRQEALLELPTRVFWMRGVRFVQKPFSTNEMVQEVRDVLDSA